MQGHTSGNLRMQHDTCPCGFVALLKACAKHKDLPRGSRVHANLVRTGLLNNHVFAGSALINMYAKCGSLSEAQHVFDNLQIWDAGLWNALIAGYVQHGHANEALQHFERMQLKGFSPTAVTYISILKACGSARAAEYGQDIHAQIVREGLLKKDLIVGNALVDMYAKCGLLAKALEVLEKLPVRDVVSWSTLIGGYAQCGNGEEALSRFEQMQLEGVSPNVVTFICVLKACGSIGASDKGQTLHAEILRQGLLGKHVIVGNALIDMYGKCGLLAKAQEVFDSLPHQDVASWNALITGYVQHEHGEKALNCFESMQIQGLSPNAVTFTCVFKACGRVGAAQKGQEIHAEIAREGFPGNDIVVGTALVDMYAKCGLLAKAREVFDKLPGHNVVSWSTLITGYAQHGHAEEALNCFERMQHEGISPNAVTFACVLKACGSLGAANKGQAIHADIFREGILEEHIVVGNALVDMYAKCGLLVKAYEVFDKLQNRDVVSWSALIGGYVQYDHCETVLNCFERMQLEHVSPNEVTFIYLLRACGTVGAAGKGQEIHSKIVGEGILEKDGIVANAVIDMYAKCGLLENAQELFDVLPNRDVVSWNALITGYALLGKAEDVFSSFGKMIEEGARPDLVTFTSLLNACSHAGLLEKGQMLFEVMSRVYDIIATSQHYTCMIDLFARAGRSSKVVALIKNMPFSVSLAMWHTVLGACRTWGGVELGRVAFERAVQLDEKDAATYICMGNIYSDAGRLEDIDS